MREIKFRAYRKDIKKMLYPSLPIIEGGNGLELLFGNEHYKWVFVEPETGFVMGTPEDSELMQYTGLKDKNGKEIYEGDIVQWSANSRKAEVMFGHWDNREPYEAHEFGYGWFVEYQYQYRKRTERHQTYLDDRPMMVDTHTMTLEVIGNIYENPELLQQA